MKYLSVDLSHKVREPEACFCTRIDKHAVPHTVPVVTRQVWLHLCKIFDAEESVFCRCSEILKGIKIHRIR